MDLSEIKNLPKTDHTPAVLDEPAKLLLKAADLIEKHGLWCGGYEGGRCILTGLIDAEGRTTSLGRHGNTAFERVTQALGVKGRLDESGEVYNWNDRHSKEAVVAKLRAVALSGGRD